MGPNEAIRLGFIGCGIQSRGLLSGFLKLPHTRVVAVCDVDTTRRENHKQITTDFYSKQSDIEFKGCTGHNDFRELLARQDIDAVVIATPDHWHAIIAVAAAAAGKDIYCEKPLTNTIHEASALSNAVQLHQRVFQTGSMQRSSREFRVACELVRNGVLRRGQKCLSLPAPQHSSSTLLIITACPRSSTRSPCTLSFTMPPRSLAW